MSKTRQSCSDKGFLEEDMSEGIAIIGQSEEFHKRVLIETYLHFEHVFLGLGQNALEQTQGAVD